jgi:hypothetical protein
VDIYYQLDKISQSRLNVVKSLRDGEMINKVKKETLDFGHQFHEATLQKIKYKNNLLCLPEYKPYKHKIANMVKAAQGNAVLQMLLSDPESIIEDDHFFNEDRYDLECKLRADILNKARRTVLDLKSTSETTREGFEAAIRKYGYHRQGAFYLDALECDIFIIVAVSKIQPYRTFTYCMNWNDEIIQDGHNEYEDLIDYYIENRDKINFNELMKAQA